MDSQNRHAHLQSFGARAYGLSFPQIYTQYTKLNYPYVMHFIPKSGRYSATARYRDNVDAERYFNTGENIFSILLQNWRKIRVFYMLFERSDKFSLAIFISCQDSLWILMHVKETFTRDVICGKKRKFMHVCANSNCYNNFALCDI